MKYLQIKFPTTTIQAEELSDALWDLGALSTSFEDCEDIPIYEPELDQTVLWENTRVIALFEETIKAELILNALKTNYPNLYIPDNLTIELLEDQEWTRMWMDQYQPMCFGEKLWIYPSTQEIDNLDKIVVHLDPGLAFGTGTHPTTRMCLQWLDYATSQGWLQDKTIIDYGCGSGILAIAALKLGAKKVIGIDIDPQAIEASISNSKNNNVAENLQLYLAQDYKHQDDVDIIISNILAGPLVELAPTFATLQKKNSRLVISGILNDKELQIQQAYQDFYELETPQHDEEWLMFAGVHK